MLKKIYWLTFIFILISISFINKPQIPAAATSADVKYDGERLSVHAEEFPIGQLLSMLEKQTGILFSYDDSLAEETVFANFENNSLADGIRRILLQFNYATIYDESGQYKYILILKRKRASSKYSGDPTALHASQQQSDINDIPVTFLEQVEPPPDAMPVAIADQEDAPPLSGEFTGQWASIPDIPPGSKEGETPPPPGEKPLTPVVDPNVTQPPGAEPLAPVVDPNVSPPLEEEALEPTPSLEPNAESTFPTNTEKQADSQADRKNNRLADLSGPLGAYT